MEWWQEFITVFLLMFALLLFLAGIFTAYFGSGKSRAIGAGLLICGIIIGLLVFFMYHNLLNVFDGLRIVLKTAVIYLVSAILGALAAIGLFLLVIMKS